MNKLTDNLALSDFKRLKSAAETSLIENDFESAIKIITCAADIAYHLNFKYADDDLEEMLNKIGNKTLNRASFTPIKNRIVFYDAFGIDNRGLTQQYLDALNRWDVDYLYIKEGEPLNESGDIHKLIASNKRAKCTNIPRSRSKLDEAKLLLKTISEYAPEKAFLHIAPWSTTAVVAWSMLPQVERFLIDLTDHAFWIGKSCTDYFVGFRDYGISVSENYRGIQPHKLLKQPYYPIQNAAPFEGFPFNRNDKVVIFTGGALYKMYGENFQFLKILKRIANENPSAIILVAANGDERPIKSFIKKHNLCDQIIHTPERKDITELFLHSDIYLNTYPVIGALMSQYAIMCNKPLIGYTSNDIPCNYSEDLFLHNDYIKFTYFNLEEFHNAINKLIRDGKFRQEFTAHYKGLLLSPDEFSRSLLEVITKKPQASTPKIKFEENEFSRFKKIYMEIENEFLHKYQLIKFKRLGLRYFKIDPHGAIISAISLIINFKSILTLQTIHKAIKQLKAR